MSERSNPYNRPPRFIHPEHDPWVPPVAPPPPPVPPLATFAIGWRRVVLRMSDCRGQEADGFLKTRSGLRLLLSQGWAPVTVPEQAGGFVYAWDKDHLRLPFDEALKYARAERDAQVTRLTLNLFDHDE